MPTSEQVEAIITYAKRVNTAPSEAARVSTFAAMLRDVFGDNPSAREDLTASIESSITYYTEARGGARMVRYGRLDAMIGNTILEFKQKIKDGRTTGLEELKKYALGLSQRLKVDSIPFEGILTDGITFERYDLLVAPGKKLALENVTEVKLESFALAANERSAVDFYWFVSRNLLSERGLEPTPSSFSRIFGRHGRVYAQTRRALEAAWEGVKKDSDVRLARSQWAMFLQYATATPPDGEPVVKADDPKGDELYITHTYLACLSRFMVWAAFGTPEIEEESGENIIRDVLEGVLMDRLRVQGMSDRDAFHWVLKDDVSAAIRPAWRQVLEELRAFRLKNLQTDVLKVLYEELVDPVERHELGEYYTPDWLCRAVVEELIVDTPHGVPKVLDPSCGSGSFLVATIRLMRERMDKANTKPWTIAPSICESVVGFDIHPLAVMVAKANYMLALGDSLDVATDYLSFPVYLADSIGGEKEDSRPTLMETYGMPLSIGDPRLEEIHIPPAFTGHQSYDKLVTLARHLAEDAVSDNPTPDNAVIRILEREFAGYRSAKTASAKAELLKAVTTLASQMEQLSREGRDTIWAWFAKNFYRPELYKRQFDYVVGNPPWLSFRYIGNPKYKKTLERMALERYRVASEKSSLRTQTEVATTFMAHSVNWFLKNDHSLAAMVLPRAVFSSDQHEYFREGPVGPGCTDFSITGLWDLADVQPVFNVPACVVFAQRKGGVIGKGKAIPGEVFSGRLPEREPDVAEALKRVKRKKVKFGLARMGAEPKVVGDQKVWGGRTAWVVGDKPPQLVGKSWYADKFFQGATIVPRNAFFIQTFAPIPAGLDIPVEVKTDPEQRKTAKMPWKDLTFSGPVERRFLFKTAIAKDVLPFLVGPELPDVVLPLEVDKDGGMKLMTAAELRDEGYRYAHKYFAKVEDAWKKHRKGAASSQTDSIVQQLDYMKKLTGHDLSKRWVVVFARSGTNAVSAVLDRKKQKSSCFMDFALYRYETNAKSEASYLAAVLNCEAVNDIIKPFQSRGLLGERDVAKKILDVPFPKFDPKNPIHTELAELGEQCATIASKAVATLKGTTLGAKRTAMRVVLKDELKQIDSLVKQLIGV